MRKTLAVLAAALLLLSACGKESEEGDIAALGTSTPATSDAPGTSEAPDETAPPDANEPGGDEPAATADGGTTKTSAPAKTAAPGTPNEPKVGTYTYTIKGKATDPFNPTAPPQDYAGEAQAEISREGSVTTRTDTSDQQAGRVTIRTKRETDRVLLLSFKAETQAGDFSCTFDPPLVITKFPVKPEKYGTQHFKGSGNACDGTLDIEILRKEAAKDANGKSWDTWVVFVKQYFKSGTISSTTEQTRWVSPDLGIEVKSDGKTSGQLGTQKFSATGTSLLKKYP